MAVYAPGDDSPPNAIDPGMWARLMGYAGALNPIGAAHAGGVQAPDSPQARQAAIAAAAAQLNNGGAGAQPPGLQGPPVPSGITAVNPPIPPNTHGDGPPGPISPVAGGPAASSNMFRGGGYGGGQSPVNLARIQAAIDGGGSSGGAGASATVPIGSEDNASRNPAPWFPSGNNPLPWNGPPPQAQQQQAVPLASTPLPPVRPAGLGAPAAAVDPRMRGEVPPVAQPGWDTISRPNQNPGIGGGMLGPQGPLAANQGPRGNGGPDQMGMFNFGNLFGGGQPAAAAAVPAKTKINVGKIPPGMRAEVPPSKRSKVASEYGPLQKGWTWGGKDYNPDLYR